MGQSSKLAEGIKKTELGISVHMQGLNGPNSILTQTPRRVDQAQLGNLGPELDLTGEHDRWHEVKDGTTVQKHQC